MTFVREHDCLVEAVLHGLGLGQSRIDVDAGDLGTGGGGVVVDPAPARDHAADAALDVDVVAERRDVDRERISQIMKSDADLFGTLEGQRPEIYILSEVVFPDELDAGLAELVQRNWDFQL